MKLFAAVLVLAVIAVKAQDHPDIGLNVYELIERYNFVWSEYEVQTEDGYILTIQRIPSGRTGASGKGPVLLMHGLTSSSADWVNTGNKSLAFLMADAGYDVWLGNSRGNRFGRRHILYDPDVNIPEFWNFSWDQIGRYDLPAIIDKILAETGDSSVYYAGHSQGTTSFFVMASERPEYNAKIRLMQALSPIAFMEHLFSPIPRALAPNVKELTEWLHGNNIWEIKAVDENAHEVCRAGNPLAPFCRSVIQMLCGYDEEQLSADQPSIIVSNTPAGAGLNNFGHYGQEINSGHFRQYDYYSPEANLAIYGQPEPPDYNISNIVAPVALHYGQNDWFAAIVDVHKLRDLLPNVVEDNMIEYELFTHADFLWAKDVDVLLYNRVLELFEQF